MKPKQKRPGYRFTPTDEQRSFVKMLAGKMTDEDIAELIINPYTTKSITAKTLASRFKAELYLGHTQCKAFAIGQLFKLMKALNPASVFFYLKTQCGWRETIGVDHSGKLTHELVSTADLSKLTEEERAAIDAGKITEQLIQKLVASARVAAAQE